MRSKAQVKGHPLHPIFVNFPIAFFLGTWLFDGLAYATPSLYLSFSTTALYIQIAGIGFSLVAAIPGIIDYVYTVPPESTAKSRAAQHGLLNVTTVALFSISLFYKLISKEAQPLILIGLETIAIVLMAIAGWLGGTLVNRNQIGIDIRYAGAGKWKELHAKAQNGKVRLEGMDRVQPGQMVLLHVASKRIVLANAEGKLLAFEDRCTHRGGSLAAGALVCGTVQCPWHGSQFDVATGEVKAGPATKKIDTFVITQEKDQYYLIL